jgi:hypothetical protein
MHNTERFPVLSRSGLGTLPRARRGDDEELGSRKRKCYQYRRRPGFRELSWTNTISPDVARLVCAELCVVITTLCIYSERSSTVIYSLSYQLHTTRIGNLSFPLAGLSSLN